MDTPSGGGKGDICRDFGCGAFCRGDEDRGDGACGGGDAAGYRGKVSLDTAFDGSEDEMTEKDRAVSVPTLSAQM